MTVLALDTHMRTVRYLRPESISAYWPLRDGSPNAAYQGELLATEAADLVGCWSLDDFTGGVARNHTGSLLHGLVSGVDLAYPGVGDGRTAGYFDGAAEISLVAADVDTDWDSAEGTLALWLKVPTAVLTDATIRTAAVFLVDGNNYVHIWKTATNNTFGAGYMAGGTFSSVQFTISDDDWHHVAITWSVAADEVRVYLDGSQAGSTQTGLGTWVGTLTQVWFGSWTGIQWWWSGRLAHIALWAAPLGTAAIAGLFFTDTRVMYDYGPTAAHGSVANINESVVQSYALGPGGVERAYLLSSDVDGDRLVLPVSGLNLDPRHFTLSFFVKPLDAAYWSNGSGNENRLLTLYFTETLTGLTPYVELYVSDAGDLTFAFNDGVTTITAAEDVSAYTEDWYHLAVSYSSADDTIRLFVDGAEVVSTTGTSRSVLSGVPDYARMGRYTDAENCFRGYYSDIVFYNAALEPDELAVLGTIQTATAVADLADNATVKGDVWKVRIVDKATNIIVAELNPESSSISRKLSETGDYSYVVPMFMPDATQIENYARSYLLLNGVTLMDGDITKVKYQMGDSGLMYNVSGLGELADLSNIRGKSDAQYTDNTVVAILVSLLTRAPGWALGDTTTMVDAGVTTTVDLRDEERLLAQITKTVESVPDLYFRYGGFDSLGNRLVDIGYFDDDSEVALEQVDDAELASRQGKLGWGGIRQINKDEDRSNILYQIEAYGGVYEDANEVDQTISLADALVGDPALGYDPDYPIVNTGNGLVVRSVANYNAGVGAEVTRFYDEHVPDTDEVPTAAEIQDAAIAAYQHAVKDLKEASGAEVTYSLDVVGLTVSNRWAKNPYYTVPGDSDIAWNGDFADLTPLNDDYADRVGYTDVLMSAFWPLNGDADDYGLYGYNASLVGAPGTTASTWGDNGTAPDLNGSSQYVNASIVSGAIDPNNFSLSMWFRNDDTWPPGSTRALFDVYIDTNYYVRGYLNNAGSLVMEARVGGVSVTSSLAPYVATVWHHVAFVVESAEFYFVLDGTLKSTPTGKGTLLGVPTTTYFGALSGPASYFNGAISDVSIYEGALTDAEVKALQYRPIGNTGLTGYAYATASNNAQLLSYGANTEGYQDTEQEVYAGDQLIFSVDITNNLAATCDFDLVLYDASGLSSETISASFTIGASAGPNPYAVSGTATEHWGELRAAVRVTQAANADLVLDNIEIMYYHELWGSPGMWRVEKGSIPLVGQKVQIVANQIGVLLDPATGIMEYVQGLSLNRKLRMDNIKINGARNRATTYAMAMSTAPRLMTTDPIIQLFDSIRQLPRKRTGAAANLASDAVASNTGSASAVSPDTTLSDGTPAKLITVALPAVPGWATGVAIAATPYSNGTHVIEVSALPALPATGLTVKVSGTNGNPWTTSDSATITAWFLFT